MTKERLVKPIVHQHLERIEDQIVVDAIAAKMGKYHDKQGPLYDHETGRSDDTMRCIAEVCADAYEEGMSHEEVWRVAQERCVDAAIGLSWNFMDEVKVGGGSTKTRRELSRHASAALYMFALDYQMDHLAASDEPDGFMVETDVLFATDMPLILREIITSEVRSMQSHGIVADDGEHPMIAVADIITRRPRELRHEAWRRNMEKAYDQTTDEDDAYIEQRQREAINRTQDALEALAYEDDPNALREPCEQTLDFVATHYGDSEEAAAAILHSIPEAYLTGLYGQDNDTARQFEDIVQRAYDGKYEIEGQTLWKLHKYLPGGLTGEVAHRHPIIMKLRAQYSDDAAFLAAALPEMPPLKHPEATSSYNQAMREMMKDVCVALFPDHEFAVAYAEDMMARSFEPRLWSNDESIGYAAYRNNDEYKTMQVILNRLLHIVKTISAERFMKIADKFDLGAIDVFSPRDIEILDILEAGDEQGIATIREQDVTLMMFDAYGDHNGAMKNIADQLNIRDTTHERILMPWRHPEDFHETLAMLRRYGIKPSTIVIANHGDPGIMNFNKGAEGFQIVSDMSVAKSDPHITRPYTIADSQMATIARHFMSIPRHGSNRGTPRKRIIAASCASDMAPESDAPSVAEMGVRVINQSDVSVIATEDYATVQADEPGRGLIMRGNRIGEHRLFPRMSNMVELSVDPTSTWINVDRQPIRQRITV